MSEDGSDPSADPNPVSNWDSDSSETQSFGDGMMGAMLAANMFTSSSQSTPSPTPDPSPYAVPGVTGSGVQSNQIEEASVEECKESNSKGPVAIISLLAAFGLAAYFVGSNISSVNMSSIGKLFSSEDTSNKIEMSFMAGAIPPTGVVEARLIKTTKVDCNALDRKSNPKLPERKFTIPAGTIARVKDAGGKTLIPVQVDWISSKMPYFDPLKGESCVFMAETQFLTTVSPLVKGPWVEPKPDTPPKTTGAPTGAALKK